MWERFREDDHRLRVGKQLCVKDPGPNTIGGGADQSVGDDQHQGLFQPGL